MMHYSSYGVISKFKNCVIQLRLCNILMTNTIKASDLVTNAHIQELCYVDMIV